MVDRFELDSASVQELFEQEDYAGVEGVSFVAVQDTGEHDNHGGGIFRLVLKRDGSDQLYAGDLSLDMGEGEIYEYPEYFVPVERRERQVTVVEYLPIQTA